MATDLLPPGAVFRAHPARTGTVSERLLGPARATAADGAARAVIEVLWSPDAHGTRCGARRAFDLVVGALAGEPAPLRDALGARTAGEAPDAALAAHRARVEALDDGTLRGACRRLYAPLRRAARPRPFLDFLRA